MLCTIELSEPTLVLVPDVLMSVIDSRDRLPGRMSCRRRNAVRHLVCEKDAAKQNQHKSQRYLVC